MPLTEKLLSTGYGVQPSQELPEETERWDSGERIFFQESKLRKKGLKIIAPPGVNLYEKDFMRIYRDEGEPVHIAFATDGDSTYFSIVRKEDIQEEGRVMLANAQYIGQLEALQTFQKDFKRGRIIHIENLTRLQGNYPLAPEHPTTITTTALFYMVMSFAGAQIPRADRLLHGGVHKLVERHPELKFDVGFFCMNYGYPFSKEMDQDRLRMIGSGIFEWIDTESFYRCPMKPEFMKESARKRLGHHFDELFVKLAEELKGHWAIKRILSGSEE